MSREGQPVTTPATALSIALQITRHCSYLRFSYIPPLLSEFSDALEAERCIKRTIKTSTRKALQTGWNPEYSGAAGDLWNWGHWITSYCNRSVSLGQSHLAIPLLASLLRTFPGLCRERDKWSYTLVHFACMYSSRDVISLLLDLDPKSFLVLTDRGCDVVTMARGVRAVTGVEDSIVNWLYGRVSELNGGEAIPRPRWRQSKAEAERTRIAEEEEVRKLCVAYRRPDLRRST